MRKVHPLLPALFASIICNAQIAVIGHTKLNNTKVTNTEITIKEKESGKIIRTLNTKLKSEFMVEVDFGKVYQIYFQNPKSPVMFLEVYGNSVPSDKYDYLMDFEMDVPFVDRRDSDVDTTVFKEPFFKIIYDGKKRMIDDTAYNNAFIEKIIRKPVSLPLPPKEEKVAEPVKAIPSTFAGKILLNDEIPAVNKKVYLMDNQGKIVKTCVTNRYGAFVFNNVMAEQITLLRMDVDDPGELNGVYKIIDSKKNVIGVMKNVNGNMQMDLKNEAIFSGKILMNNDIPVANKIVYLIDNQGKVVKTAVTNPYGAFVFNNVMPEQVTLLKMDVDDPSDLNSKYMVIDSKKNRLATLTAVNGSMQMDVKSEYISQSKNLVDNDYTTNIGGKLVYSSSKEKKFFAEKTVYLSNKYHTILKKTKTNVLGSFVFEDIKPEHDYFIGVDKTDVPAGAKIDLLSKEDNYISTLDTIVAERVSLNVNSSQNKKFSDMSVGDNEVKMGIQGTIFGDNVNTPIGKLKIVLLNDNYEVIDSSLTDNLGTFKFKYLPFLKRFFLSAENTDNMLDVFKNILIYSSDNNLIKIMTHQKGNKFSYKPVDAEISRLRDVELDDPWLELMENKTQQRSAASENSVETPTSPDKFIVENILFEPNKYNVTSQAQEILDKIILVLKINTALKLEIGAHTDSKGSAASNMTLSQMRAKTVREYIMNSGVDAKRIISKGYGETKLKNNCGDDHPCSETEHAQNRRIEFKILEE